MLVWLNEIVNKEWVENIWEKRKKKIERSNYITYCGIAATWEQMSEFWALAISWEKKFNAEGKNIVKRKKSSTTHWIVFRRWLFNFYKIQ